MKTHLSEKKRKILREGFILAGVAILISVYLFVWKMETADSNIYYTLDFNAFYTAGKIAKDEGASSVYNLEKQLHVQMTLQDRDIVPNELLSYNHVPFLIPLLREITNENFIASFARWAIILLAINIGCAIILLKNFLDFSRMERVVAASGIILFYPSIVSILKGQDSVIMLFGASLWMIGLIQKKDKMAGLGLALVTVRPHIALALAIPFIFRRRKVFLWFAIGASILALFSIALIGIEGALDFIQLLTISSRGEGFQLHPQIMFNLVGVLVRRFPSIPYNTLEIIAWLSFCISIVGTSILWRRSDEIGEAHIATMVILSLFTAPHLHHHDLALLLLPILANLRIFVLEKKIKTINASVIPLSISLALFVNNHLPSRYPLLYLFMLILAILPWLSNSIRHLTTVPD